MIEGKEDRYLKILFKGIYKKLSMFDIQRVIFKSFVRFCKGFAFVFILTGLLGAESIHFSDKGCHNCHLDMKKPKLLKEGPNKLCEGCHPDVHPTHKVGVKTKLNREHLPLDEEGRITCAYTCHIMHSKGDSVFEKKLLRMDINKLCFSCHDK